MKLAVIGAGLIGHSVALAARRADRATAIVEIDRNDSLEAARGADLIVLAVPVGTILELLATQADVLREAVTVDTGSTKRAIVLAARSAGLDRFVGGHPLAGAASSGPSGARADLFDGKPWFLAPHGASADALSAAEQFVASLGARPVLLEDDGSEHDRVMGAVSHLPQVVASVLMTVVAGAAGDRLSWAGSGLRDTTRLASSSAAMWESILSSNAAAVRPLLLELASELSRAADGLDNPTAIRQLFERANRARATLEK